MANRFHTPEDLLPARLRNGMGAMVHGEQFESGRTYLNTKGGPPSFGWVQSLPDTLEALIWPTFWWVPGLQGSVASLRSIWEAFTRKFFGMAADDGVFERYIEFQEKNSGVENTVVVGFGNKLCCGMITDGTSPGFLDEVRRSTLYRDHSVNAQRKRFGEIRQ